MIKDRAGVFLRRLAAFGALAVATIIGSLATAQDVKVLLERDQTFYTEFDDSAHNVRFRVLVRLANGRYDLDVWYKRYRDRFSGRAFGGPSGQIRVQQELQQFLVPEGGFGAQQEYYYLNIQLADLKVRSTDGVGHLVDTDFLCPDGDRFRVCGKTRAYVQEKLNLPARFADLAFQQPVINAVTARATIVKRPGGDDAKPAGVSDDLALASSGTGFFVSAAGRLVTNAHVVDECVQARSGAGDANVEFAVVTMDKEADLALLQAPITPKQHFAIRPDDGNLMEEVFVAGFPFAKLLSDSVKVTKGIVSSLQGIGNNDAHIQVDAALQAGNSGGPIFDGDGRVVGVAVAKLNARQVLLRTGALPENTNFGVKASALSAFLKQHGVDASRKSKPLSGAALGRLVTEATVRIDCWRKKSDIRSVLRR